MSEYELVCTGEYNDLVLIEKMVERADAALPNWSEIRMEKSGNCFAFTAPPKRRSEDWWLGNIDDDADFVGMGKKRWGWKTFCIIRYVTEEVTAENATTE